MVLPLFCSDLLGLSSLHLWVLGSALLLAVSIPLLLLAPLNIAVYIIICR